MTTHSTPEWFPSEYNEVVVLLRNTKTGKESWMKMPNTFQIGIGTEMEYDDPDTLDFGFAKICATPYVKSITTTIEITSTSRSIGLSTEKIHYDSDVVKKSER